MRLKVKDLRQYLILRNIPTDTCREKEDLVELVLCHHGLGTEQDMDAGSLRSSRSQSSAFFTHPFSTSVSMSNPGEAASRRGSTGSGTPSRVHVLCFALFYIFSLIVMYQFKIKHQLIQFGGTGKMPFVPCI